MGFRDIGCVSAVDADSTPRFPGDNPAAPAGLIQAGYSPPRKIGRHGLRIQVENPVNSVRMYGPQSVLSASSSRQRLDEGGSHQPEAYPQDLLEEQLEVYAVQVSGAPVYSETTIRSLPPRGPYPPGYNQVIVAG